VNICSGPSLARYGVTKIILRAGSPLPLR
jgi:hypothetical protein